MRLPLIALLLVASASSLAAQSGRGPGNEPERRPAPATGPRTAPFPGPNPYYDPRYRILNPRLSMDSATFIVEARYEGWHVDSKVLTRERGRPVYIFGMIAGGEVGTRLVQVDGDNGEVLNPEIMGDTTSSDRRHGRYRSSTSTPRP